MKGFRLSDVWGFNDSGLGPRGGGFTLRLNIWAVWFEQAIAPTESAPAGFNDVWPVRM